MTSLTQPICTVQSVEKHARQNSFLAALKTIAANLRQRRKNRERRDAFNTMLHLDDRMLSDIGVTRDDVRWASRLPLSVNASEELRRLSQKAGTMLL